MQGDEEPSDDLVDLLGQGTVFLSYFDDRVHGGPHGWFGYWDLAPDGPPTCLEQADLQPTAEAAVKWGRARSKRVLIRMDPLGPHGHSYLWAGTAPRPADIHDDFIGGG